MFNFLSTFGADTQFQKNRLLLTKPTYEAPNEQALRNILHSFAGQDEQIRSQIAFACIIKKIHNSNGKQNWVYLLKNLIILDRVMSDNRFCQELAQTNLFTINNFVDKDAKSEAVNAKFLLKTFWQLVQDVCRLKVSRKHILYYKRSERKGFLQTLSTQQLFTEIKILQRLFDNTISLIFLTSGISSNRQKSQRQTQTLNQKSRKYYIEFVNSPLAEYLNIHLYSKLLTFFSCQYLCIHKFIQVILHTTKTEEHVLVSVEDAKMFKKMIFRFKGNCFEMKSLVDKNKTKKGFENIDTKEFSAFNQEHIIKAIDEYISQHSTHQKLQIFTNIQTFSNPSSQYLKPPQSKFVDKKPLIFRLQAGRAQKTPRKLIEFKKDHEQQKAFEDYFDSYSDQFPHKNMMTIDLIEDIRRDEERMYQDILDSVQSADFQENLQENKNKEDFFKQFKKLKSKVKFHDILIFDKDEKEEEKQDSTNYSFKNSSRQGSLFDVLNLKWLPQKSEV